MVKRCFLQFSAFVERQLIDVPPPECDVTSPHCPANDLKYYSSSLFFSVYRHLGIEIFKRRKVFAPSRSKRPSAEYYRFGSRILLLPSSQVFITYFIAFDGLKPVTYKIGKSVIVAAHGNSLRALVKYLDNIPEDVIAELNIPTGAPLVYTLDENLKPIPHKDSIAPLQGYYLGNQDEIRARILGVKNQTK